MSEKKLSDLENFRGLTNIIANMGDMLQNPRPHEKKAQKVIDSLYSFAKPIGGVVLEDVDIFADKLMVNAKKPSPENLIAVRDILLKLKHDITEL